MLMASEAVDGSKPRAQSAERHEAQTDTATMVDYFVANVCGLYIVDSDSSIQTMDSGDGLNGGDGDETLSASARHWMS